MLKVLQKIGEMLPWGHYAPNLRRREEVVGFLAKRPTLSHEEWHCRYAADIPLDFVSWFRDACSKYFEYDLSAALPEDRLLEDLGMYKATWGDVDWDILEDYESRYGAKIPTDAQSRITTFGRFLDELWSHAKGRQLNQHLQPTPR
jgi:hypothetical protein